MYDGNEIQCYNNANITIQNSLIDHCTQGINIYNSAPTVSGNNINEPYSNGIYVDASSNQPRIVDNIIKKVENNYRNYQGIWLINSSNAFIFHNDISGFYWGIYIGGGSLGLLFNSPEDNTNNRVVDCRYGIAAGWGSGIIGGFDWADYGHYNSIHDNVYYDVRSYENSWVIAEYDYWGGEDPKKFVDGTSQADINYVLEEDPWITPPASLILANNIESSPQSDFYSGIVLENEGKIDDAIFYYKDLIKKDKHFDFAITQLAHLKCKYSRNEIANYFVDLATNSKHKAIVNKLIADMYLQNDQFDYAINLYDDVIKNYPNNYQALNSRFSKLFAYLNIKKDNEKAEQILSDIKALRLDDDEYFMRLTFAEDLLQSAKSSIAKQSSNNNSQIILNTLNEYKLLGNYPNPFNPTTVISYILPRTSDVEVKIYNILGHEVKSFLISSQSAGTQNIVWNGTNNYNEQVSSGIYIYRFKAVSQEGKNETFEKSAKLVLMK